MTQCWKHNLQNNCMKVLFINNITPVQCWTKNQTTIRLRVPGSKPTHLDEHKGDVNTEKFEGTHVSHPPNYYFDRGPLQFRSDPNGNGEEVVVFLDGVPRGWRGNFNLLLIFLTRKKQTFINQSHEKIINIFFEQRHSSLRHELWIKTRT